VPKIFIHTTHAPETGTKNQLHFLMLGFRTICVWNENFRRRK